MPGHQERFCPLFPAHAGMNRECSICIHPFRTVPRARGDEPVSEAGYLTVTLAVGAGFGLSNQAASIVKELRK